MHDTTPETDEAAVLLRLEGLSGDEFLPALAREIARLTRANAALSARVAALETMQGLADRILSDPDEAPDYPDEARIDAADSSPDCLGFHSLERDEAGQAFRWTGPDRRFSFRLLVDRRRPLRFRLRFDRLFAEAPVEALRCRIDGREAALTVVRRGDGFEAAGVLPARDEPGGTALVFICPKTGSPPEGPSSDRRRLGLFFRRLVVRPEGEAEAEPFAEGAAADEAAPAAGVAVDAATAGQTASAPDVSPEAEFAPPAQPAPTAENAPAAASAAAPQAAPAVEAAPAVGTAAHVGAPGAAAETAAEAAPAAKPAAASAPRAAVVATAVSPPAPLNAADKAKRVSESEFEAAARRIFEMAFDAEAASKPEPEPEPTEPAPTQARVAANDGAFAGRGFYSLEFDERGRAYRWTGPDARFTIPVLVDRSRPVDLALRFGRLFTEAPPPKLAAFVDGEALPVAVSGSTGDFVALATLPQRRGGGVTEMSFVCPAVGSPAESGASDRRVLGLTFYWLAAETRKAAPEGEGAGAAGGAP